MRKCAANSTQTKYTRRSLTNESNGHVEHLLNSQLSNNPNVRLQHTEISLLINLYLCVCVHIERKNAQHTFPSRTQLRCCPQTQSRLLEGGLWATMSPGSGLGNATNNNAALLLRQTRRLLAQKPPRTQCTKLSQTRENGRVNAVTHVTKLWRMTLTLAKEQRTLLIAWWLGFVCVELDGLSCGAAVCDGVSVSFRCSGMVCCGCPPTKRPAHTKRRFSLEQ